MSLAARETEFLPRAIEAFHDQTYQNKDLVIVMDPDGHFDYLQKLAAGALIVASPKRSIGAKRNIGCEYATGEYIAVWDDDDFSAPMRLHWQMEAMLARKKQVTALRRIYMTTPARQDWWMSWDCMIGADTSLVFSRKFWEAHQFGDFNVGTEGDFMRAAHAAGQMALMDAPALMYATNHPGNTADRSGMYGPNNKLKGFKWPTK